MGYFESWNLLKNWCCNVTRNRKFHHLSLRPWNIAAAKIKFNSNPLEKFLVTPGHHSCIFEEAMSQPCEKIRNESRKFRRFQTLVKESFFFLGVSIFLRSAVEHLGYSSQDFFRTQRVKKKNLVKIFQLFLCRWINIIHQIKKAQILWLIEIIFFVGQELVLNSAMHKE